MSQLAINGGPKVFETPATVPTWPPVNLETAEKLKEILDLDLLDFISLDVKTTFSKYKKITGANIGFTVKKSMELINSYPNVNLEIRTTFVPTLISKKDIHNLVDEIEADIYTIQQFRNKNVLDPALEKVENPNPHDLIKLAEEIKPDFDGQVKVKTSEFGEQVI